MRYLRRFFAIFARRQRAQQLDLPLNWSARADGTFRRFRVHPKL